MKLSSNIVPTKEYKSWISELKQKFQQAQIKAAVKVNSALLEFYWELGAAIVEKQKNVTWGTGFLKQLSFDLMQEFPDIKGFSYENLKLIRRWSIFYTKENSIGEQAVTQLTISEISQLFQIPWGQNIVVISKSKTIKEALFYVAHTVEYGWSRAVLTHQIESGLFERSGKAITNFKDTLLAPQSDLANQLIKDPYNFDFLTLTKDYNERELEKNLIEHITKFLIELGAGFAYVGKQIELHVGERDFYVDLLFYHIKLHSYVVIELKTVDFEPEHAGKLNFYIKAVDKQLRTEGDNPTIGILLCKSKDKVVAEYALSDIHKPMGVSEYELTKSLPTKFRSSLPTIEEIEAELMQEKK
jgi:predicted nuclease of restriction endonuclease-like (RecB) superfamily